MSQEGQLLDKKSLRTISENTAGWKELTKDCVAFANAAGGHILIGIEDRQDAPPAQQRIPPQLVDTLRRKLAERTVNVTALPNITTDANGGEYIDLHIPRSASVASTTDGRYFLRIADQSKPITGDEIMRLASERGSVSWETQTTLGIPRLQRDDSKLRHLAAALRASDRVKDSVKEKTEEELLDHYLLASGQHLTNLGILCIGTQQQRAQLAASPVVQFLKYDGNGQKISKQVWDDHTHSPMELIESIWRDIPDFRESYELPDGLYRQNVPAFDEIVVRELLVNALVHRPYTQRGDIFLNIYPDRLEAVNPGPLPLGVTPDNVLHTTVRRNEHLARLFHDLKLMEREGSGFDKMFEVLLSQGKAAPELVETHDSVCVTVRRAIIRREIIDFIAKADQLYQLTQRERIVLGLLAQHDALGAKELARTLGLPSASALRPWLKRLVDWQLVQSSGRTQSMRYHIDAHLLRQLEFPATTTLARIEPYRLEALILEDLQRYPKSAIGGIRKRIGEEIHPRQIKRALDALIERGAVHFEGSNRWRRYWRQP